MKQNKKRLQQLKQLEAERKRRKAWKEEMEFLNKKG